MMAGAPPDVIAAARKQQQPSIHDFYVWPENWDSLDFFIQLNTQWNVVSGMGGERVSGLNYQAVEAMMRIKSIPRNKKESLFNDLRLMENAALEVLQIQREEQ